MNNPWPKSAGRVFLSALLLIALAGLLGIYWGVVRDLPTQIYTEAQWEYLLYNERRDVSQVAPTFNTVLSDGTLTPTILPVNKSRVRATLTARYEEREGVSATVYGLDFFGEYSLSNTGPTSTTIQLFFPFPSNLETLHEVQFLVDGKEPLGVGYSTKGIFWQASLGPDQARLITISYKANGANSFAYGLQHEQRADLDVTITVVGLSGSEVPQDALAPTTSTPAEDGEVFSWTYENLIVNRDIQLTLPARLTFAQRVSMLQGDFRALATVAPLLIGLFLAALAGQFHWSGVRLRLEGYLLSGCALALFYPALTFLSGMLDVILAAGLALLVVSALLLVFVGLAAGWRRTWWRLALLLIVFLGLFSLGLLTPWQGLFLTAGGLVLVGLFMLAYARRPKPAVLEPVPEPAEEVISEPTPQPILERVSPEPAPTVIHCLHCGRALAEDYAFCPGCGCDTASLYRCVACGREQFVPEGQGVVYCLHCGQQLDRTPRGDGAILPTNG